MAHEVISRFLARSATGNFDSLALELLRSQHERSDTAETVGSWEEVEAVSARQLAATRTPPADADTIARVREAEWQILRPRADVPLLLLAQDNAPESTSTDRIAFDTWPAEVTVPFRQSRLDGIALRSWLAARQRAGHPVSIVADAVGLGHLVTDLDRRRLRFRLPPGSRFVCRSSYRELLRFAPFSTASIREGLGISGRDVVYLIEEPTLTSRIPVIATPEDGLRLGPPPAWARFRISSGVDPGFRLVVLDLATNLLPACQALDWEVDATGELELDASLSG